MFDVTFHISGKCHVPDADFEASVSEIEKALAEVLSSELGLEVEIHVSEYVSREIPMGKGGE